MKNKYLQIHKKRNELFPSWLFFSYMLFFLIASGLHTGLIVMIGNFNLSALLKTLIIVSYWIIISVTLTIYSKRKMKIIYEEPLMKLANAAALVAAGDFSVYVEPLNRADKFNYIDDMINDFNKMVEDLGSIETLKVDFFSNVSHEIKQPISVVQGTAELLQRKDLSYEQRMEYVLTISTATKKLSQLITNILKLNKLEKETISPNISTYDLTSQLAECSLMFESAWEKKNIEFNAQLDDIVYIKADKSLMELVWSNIISNAIKFTKIGGTISVTEKVVGDNVVVSISDTGIGMSQETQKRMFDKFYQGDLSHSVEGNGLGLAMVKQILNMMDFVISVESALGKGTAFIITIPLNRGNNEQEY